MKEKTFEVPIKYSGASTYLVKAENKEEAEELARARYENGEDGDLPHIESERIEKIGEIEEIWGCPHCGSTKGTWFDRTITINSKGEETMANRCEDCGKDVDD